MENEFELTKLCEFFTQLNNEVNPKEHSAPGSQHKLPVWQLSKMHSQDSDEFDRFLNANGGIYGGWQELHHQHYVNLRAKHNLSSIVFIFRQNFPEITEQEILEHDKWYTKYLRLKVNHNKTTRIHRETNDASDELNNDLRSVTSMKMTAKRDKGAKIEIKRWKEWKGKMNEERKKQEEFETEMQRKRNHVKWLQHLHKKKLVTEYQTKKLEKIKAFERARTNKELEERRIRSATANKMLAVFRQKDKTWLHEKRTKKQLTQQAQQERLNNLHAVISKLRSKINTDRDPYRLLVPTVEWKQKMRKVNYVDALMEPTNNEKTKIINIVRVQHLATPKWRRRAEEETNNTSN